MGTIHASHTVEIDAPRERVYDVAADVPGATAWNPATEKVNVIESDREGRAPSSSRSEADAMVKKTKSTMRFRYDPPNGLSWTQEKGEVKSLDGRWELTQLDATAPRPPTSSTSTPAACSASSSAAPLRARSRSS